METRRGFIWLQHPARRRQRFQAALQAIRGTRRVPPAWPPGPVRQARWAGARIRRNRNPDRRAGVHHLVAGDSAFPPLIGLATTPHPRNARPSNPGRPPDRRSHEFGRGQGCRERPERVKVKRIRFGLRANRICCCGRLRGKGCRRLSGNSTECCTTNHRAEPACCYLRLSRRPRLLPTLMPR